MESLRAKYSYEAKNPDELSFKANDEVSLLQKTDTAGWWLVENKHNKRGLVPANYFDTISPPDTPPPSVSSGPPARPPPSQLPAVPNVNGVTAPAPTSSPPPIVTKFFHFPDDGKERAVAQEDYTAKDASQLSFKKDDVIIVLQKFPTGWMQGDLNGNKGVFPAKTIKFASEIMASQSDDKKKHRRSRSATNRDKDKADSRRSRTLTVGSQLRPELMIPQGADSDEGSDDDVPTIYNLNVRILFSNLLSMNNESMLWRKALS